MAPIVWAVSLQASEMQRLRCGIACSTAATSPSAVARALLRSTPVLGAERSISIHAQAAVDLICQ